MEKGKFIKKMKEYNYTDEEIEKTLLLMEECQKEGVKIPYEAIILEKAEEGK